MASSRIFVKGLPPTLTEGEFKKHFSSQHPTTDIKLFPQRRIGYVGYRTPEEAAKAVKYFNKSFMRMSRIYVESARPIAENNPRDHTQAQRSSFTNTNTTSEESSSLKRKREDVKPQPKDSKLQDYLEAMQRPSKSKGLIPGQGIGNEVVEEPSEGPVVQEEEAESESEYQDVRKKSKTDAKTSKQAPPVTSKAEELADTSISEAQPPDTSEVHDATVPPASSDADWLRTRTSRLLDLESDGDDDEDDEEGGVRIPPTTSAPEEDSSQSRTAALVKATLHESAPVQDEVVTDAMDVDDANEDDTPKTQYEDGRLFVRNMPYGATEDDLEQYFAPYGDIKEVHIPINKKSGTPKGFAYVQFEEAENATKAVAALDGLSFQGRLLHILPAAAKKDSKLDEFEISKLPLKKQQQIRKKAEAAKTTFNWNSLYMNMDAVMSSVADRLGVSKSELLDPTSSDAAIKQAHAETHVISETKSYFTDNGVDLEAFRKRERGDTAILVKNFPYDTKTEELRNLFEQYGTITRLLIPPSGTIAIVQFAQATEARSAFAALAYRKFKDTVIFLEKAPKDLFKASFEASNNSRSMGSTSNSKDAKISASDLLQKNENVETMETATLFVRNLNFSTSTQKLTEVFQPLDGFVAATVKTKINPKEPSQKLSMGFGFLEFRTNEQAQAAALAMNGYDLEGHKLLIRASHKGVDAAEERRKEDRAKKAANKHTKIIIKNLPFETSKKDVRALFGAYGQLRSVRVPKKFDNSARGFAFAEFTTPREAENAMDALRNTHLLGRKLVLEFAAQETEDAEEELERMQKKVGSQVNKVALQKLTGAGRKKFTVADDDGEE